MSKQTIGRLLYLPLLFPLTACSADTEGSGDPTLESTGIIGEGLRLGSTGPEVERLHHYLEETGYLPNARLSTLSPSWRPVVASSPKLSSVFDESTELAVKAVQRQAGMDGTGVVDATTREVMDQRFCGTPEDGAVRQHAVPGEPVEKYAYGAPKRTNTSVRWKIDNISRCPAELKVNGDCTAYVREQITSAISDWRAASSLTFSETTGTANLVFHFEAQDSAAVASAVVGSTLVTINTTPSSGPWSRNGLMQRVMLHEMGHAFGLRHSSVPPCTSANRRCTGSPENPVMFWAAPPNSFTEDDMTAINTYYPKWEQVPGCARDVGSTDGATWIIGCDARPGGHGIYRWNGSGWDNIPGGAERIAVSPSTGEAWVVNDSGQIFSSSFQNGSFTFSQFPGCAKDIAIGLDGTPVIIGCDPRPGGFGIYAFACFFQCDWFNIPGGATNVTVGRDNQIWLTNEGNFVFRSRADGGFDQMPGQGFDISVNRSGSPWLVGLDNALWSFADQVATTNSPISVTPKSFEWNQAAGRTASRVAVDSKYVWFAGNNIYRLRVSRP